MSSSSSARARGANSASANPSSVTASAPGNSSSGGRNRLSISAMPALGIVVGSSAIGSHLVVDGLVHRALEFVGTPAVDSHGHGHQRISALGEHGHHIKPGHTADLGLSAHQVDNHLTGAALEFGLDRGRDGGDALLLLGRKFHHFNPSTCATRFMAPT